MPNARARSTCRVVTKTWHAVAGELGISTKTVDACKCRVEENPDSRTEPIVRVAIQAGVLGQ